MNEKLRLLKPATSTPTVGDVCQMKDDEGNAFNTMIVAKVDEQNVTLARPHMVVSKVGSVFTAVEEFKVPRELWASRFELYTTGASGNTDNRVA